MVIQYDNLTDNSHHHLDGYRYNDGHHQRWCIMLKCMKINDFLIDDNEDHDDDSGDSWWLPSSSS